MRTQRFLSAFILLACLSPCWLHANPPPTKLPPIQEARQEWLEGNYAEARELYEKLAKDAKDRLPATLGLSLAWESQGQYDKALQVVEALQKEMPNDAGLLARQAELMHTRGRFDEAEKAARAALKQNDQQFLAHWVLGQVLRDRGQMDKADEQFLQLIRAANAKEIDDPVQVRLIGLAGLEHARYHHLVDQYQTVVDDFFTASFKKHKTYWPNQYEAGRVFMEKHNNPAAFRAFEKALTVNPNAAEVLVCKGQMAASSLEFKDVEKYAQRALKINPNLVSALCLMAEVHWFSGEIDATMKLLEKARAVNPRDESTLARVAACMYSKRNEAEFQAILKEAQKNNPKCYTFFNELASLLEERKFNADAEKYYNLAVAMQPKFAEAQTGLGMLYMRMAKEAEARKVLDEAFKADPFNVRVNNSLIVLDSLDKYDTLKTENFIIRFDKKNDEVLANFMASYLEDIYKDLAEQFDYRPKGPFQIQIFNKHELFSGRVVALPDLHTIGACTGPLVAMVSPRDTSKVIAKPFNWNRVIRHELVHVFNLQQTKARVPHWFTEGLAVRYEGPNIPPSWHGLLADKFHANDLLNLDNILLGFIRPRSPEQWQQAYLQSLLYVEYLTKTYGEKSVGKMLAAFAEGLDTGPALEKACNVKKDVFEKGYREFLAEKVKNTPNRPGQDDRTLKQIVEAHAKNPADVDLTTLLAEKKYKVGKKKEAKELADAVLDKEPRNAKAVAVKAKLLIEEGSGDIAYSLLDSIALDDLKDTEPLKLLAKLQFKTKKYVQAATTCERGRKLDPNDTFWLTQLAANYVKTDQKDKLIDIFEDVVKLDPDDLLPRKTLARHYQKQGKQAEAERYARMALEIDALDRESQRILVDALTAQNKQDESNRLKTIFGL